MENKQCVRIFFKKVEGNRYEKIEREVPCDKRRCQDGKLARPDKDGRVHCRHDREG